MLTFASARASELPGHEWTPRPNATWSRRFGRSRSNVAGSANRRGSRFAAPTRMVITVPAGILTPPSVVVRRAMRKSALVGLSSRSTSSVESGVRSGRARRRAWGSGGSGGVLSPLPRARGEQERGGAHDRGDVGRRAVGEGRGREPGQQVAARRSPPVLHIAREGLLEERERVEAAALLADVLHGTGLQSAELRGERLAILVWDAEQIGDHEQRER